MSNAGFGNAQNAFDGDGNEHNGQIGDSMSQQPPSQTYSINTLASDQPGPLLQDLDRLDKAKTVMVVLGCRDVPIPCRGSDRLVLKIATAAAQYSFRSFCN